MMSKIKVICDSNVWYRMGDYGYHPIESLVSNASLLITNLTYFEIISSKQVESHFDWVRSANVAIQKHGQFMLANDIQQVLLAMGLDFIEFKAIDIKEKILAINKEFVDSERADSLNYEYLMLANERVEATKTISNELMQSIVSLARNSHGLTQNSFRRILIYLLRRDVLRYVIKHRVFIRKGWFRIFFCKYYDKTFPLYLDCFSDFLFEVYKSQWTSNPMKISPNDYVDFRNLLYCTGNKKYLTLEKITGHRIGAMLRKYAGNYEYDNADAIRKVYNVMT